MAIVICIENVNRGLKPLTIGKEYRLLDVYHYNDYMFYQVIDDDGGLTYHHEFMFIQKI
jgi:hypothetical protein